MSVCPCVHFIFEFCWQKSLPLKIRLQCASIVNITGKANQFWMGVVGLYTCWTRDMTQIASIVLSPLKEHILHHNFLEADNVGMRNDVEINYQLLVFPYRELVSDFVRARKVPYCNASLACAHQTPRVRQRLCNLIARNRSCV